MKKLNQLLLNIIFISFSFYEAFAQNILRTEKYAANVKEIDYNNLIKTTARFKMPSDIKSIDFLEKTVILKLKSKFRFICTTNSINNDLFNLLYKNIEGNNLTKKFPHAIAPIRTFNENGERFADLTLIYEFNYNASFSLEKIINKLLSMQLFEYVEPHYIQQLCYTPNDPNLSTQYAITNIQAEAAWGVNSTTARGDTNVVIGITDTGVEPNHSDLKNNIKHNYNDIIGGGDADNDGYTDNFSGWDMGENDNDPSYNANPHGVHVSGIAAASVDNATGIAGIGFNCKFMPIKISNANGILTQSYEGIIYAADHGCSIINCSWGSPNGGVLGQDVIDYATINKNALVIGAAGNNGSDLLFYPAAYNYVISVANTKSDDKLSTTSNYNYTVDVCAPGESINSTYPTNNYSSQTGTSMAAPCAAGAAGIIKSFYPSYTALQIGERLKTTCDNIYSLMNSSYSNKLGNGRINLFKALTQANLPSVKMTLFNASDYNDEAFIIGDTLRINANYTNYLGATSNLTATLSSTSPYVSILDGNTTLGAINTMGIVNNNADPYIIKILSNAPLNQQVLFKITYADPATSYLAAEFFTVSVNIDYINIAINDVATSISSNGRIGYSRDAQVGGLGFNYLNNGTILYEAGLMVGVNSSKVSDAIRGISTPEMDFQTSINAHNILPAVFSELDVAATFKDNLSSSPLPIKVNSKAFAWSTIGNRKFVIVQYTIVNDGTSILNNLYAGIFADWDINSVTFASNRASFDAANKMGYAYYTGANGTYAGIKLLTNTAPVLNYAIDNLSGGAGGIDIVAGGFDTAEKYLTLSTNRPDAGTTGAGVDVIHIVSTGPYTIAAGDSIKVAFAIIAGDDLSDIQTSAVNAQLKYDMLDTSVGVSNILSNKISTMTVFPNPSKNKSTIDITLLKDAMVDLVIFNLLGEKIKTIISKNMQMGQHNFTVDLTGFSNGLYSIQLMVDGKKQVLKLIIQN